MTTAQQILTSAETFTLSSTYGSVRPRGTKIGTYVSHIYDEATGTDGTLHQVMVIPVDDETVRVYISFEGVDIRLDDLNVFRKSPSAITTAVRDEVARFLATQVA